MKKFYCWSTLPVLHSKLLVWLSFSSHLPILLIARLWWCHANYRREKKNTFQHWQQPSNFNLNSTWRLFRHCSVLFLLFRKRIYEINFNEVLSWEQSGLLYRGAENCISKYKQKTLFSFSQHITMRKKLFQRNISEWQTLWQYLNKKRLQFVSLNLFQNFIHLCRVGGSCTARVETMCIVLLLQSFWRLSWSLIICILYTFLIVPPFFFRCSWIF